MALWGGPTRVGRISAYVDRGFANSAHMYGLEPNQNPFTPSHMYAYRNFGATSLNLNSRFYS